jgi:AraC-like DNA-binding protein
MSADPEAIERALQGLERLADARLTILEVVGGSLSGIPPDRLRHSHPHCLRIKAASPLACTACDFTSCRLVLQDRPQPMWKRCHAGLWELVVPIMRDDRMLGLCFLGPWRDVAASMQPRWHDPQPAHRLKPPGGLPVPADPEALRDLTVLVCRHIALVQAPESPVLDRRRLILDLVERHSGGEIRLAAVAAHLGTSPSRASRIVRSCFGCSFPDLVESHRLERVCALLRSGELTISGIARRCGFIDHRYLSRRFRRRFGMTPGAWREAQR